MQSLYIRDNTVRLAVNDDESRVVAFDPSSIEFVERFYRLVAAFEAKEQEYKERAAELDKDGAVDAYGIPKNVAQRLSLLRETCEFTRTQIDYVFGEGTSKAAFGDINALDMFPQFFEGITPFIKQARQGKTDKYLGKGKSGVLA